MKVERKDLEKQREKFYVRILEILEKPSFKEQTAENILLAVEDSAYVERFFRKEEQWT